MNLPYSFEVVLMLLAWGLAGCGSNGTQKVLAQAPPPTVEIAQVAPAAADIYAEYPAQTYARNMVEVRGRVAGYIEKWLFRPGDDVRAGQALYVLDLSPFRAQLQQAQGTLQQTRTTARRRAARSRYWRPDRTRSPPCRGQGRRRGRCRTETRCPSAYRRRCRRPWRRGRGASP